MNVLIVYAHPSKKSYTFNVLQQIKAVLDDHSIDYTISDLYEMDFQSDMTAQEYEREGLLNLDIEIPDDVQQEHAKIEAADCILFLYPVWWSDCPAKLKGWFDRVYALGYAYGYDSAGNKVQKMKSIPYGLVICTAGHPNPFLEEIGIAGSMKNVMLDDRLGKRFKTQEMIILGGTLDLNKVKKDHSEIIEGLPMKILQNSVQ